jgi:3alpha(or 20beta)-hydroxysteroid dehydrogenase
MNGNRELAGRVALVTGGAGGIGSAIVALLAEAGAAVVFTDISAGAGEAAAERLIAAGYTVRFVLADATVEAGAAGAVEATLAAFGHLDMAINNVGNFGAGDSSSTSLEETDLTAWEATMRQCLTTCMLGMKYALRPMVAAGGGSIVNIASLAGIRVTRHASFAYHAAKAGVVHLSEAAAVLYAPQNIRVNVVAPGLTLTPNIEHTMNPATRDAISQEFHPSGRMITPREIAEAVLWAASTRSAGVTGITIPVDGGWAAR